MNKFIFALFIALFSISSINTTFAQKGKGKGTPKTPEQRATKATHRMTTNYKLDAKQVPKVKAENLAFATEMEPLRAKGKEGKPERVAARQKHRAALKAIFTPAQTAQFEADLIAAKAKRKARRQANKATGIKTGSTNNDSKDIYAMLGDDEDEDEDDK
jgi:hypothetical protein